MGMNLDRIVQFQRATLVDDGLGTVEVWADHGGTQHASRRDVSDAEKAAAGTVSAVLQTRFVVRSSSFTRDLTPIDRLVHEGRAFEITGIKEKPARRQFLEISCVARADL